MQDKVLSALLEESLEVLYASLYHAKNPVILFSGGKDSTVLLYLVSQLLNLGKLPPLLHIDTGHNYPEVLAFRDEFARSMGFSQPRVIKLTDHYSDNELDANSSRNHLQSAVLSNTIRSNGYDVVFGGARRDEDRARAKERIYSLRGQDGGWSVSSQVPEFFGQCNPHLEPGEHYRVFPLSNWTETDIWYFIYRYSIPLPRLYYSQVREVERVGNRLIPLNPTYQVNDKQAVQELAVRFRTVGDMSCTAVVQSLASNAKEVYVETKLVRTSERGSTRLDDAVEQHAMQTRKEQGYF